MSGIPGDLLNRIFADASERTGVLPDALVVTRAEAVTWNDGSLGCPEPGMFYTMALVDGYQIVVDAAGKTLVPARTDLMTLAIDDDEALRIGPWTEAGVVGPQTVVWRQNGPPLVHNGEINPLTNDNSASNWGANIDGAVVVWRSGIGLSTDRRTLYYAAGGDLMASTLAKALRAAGAHNAMQLDINSFWVQFCAVRADGTTLKPEPLFDIMKGQQPDRYLKAYTRDYFYVSAP